MALPYSEGDCFAVRLRDGGYAIGVVARSSPIGKVLLGYFFGPRRDRLPASNAAADLSADEAIKVCRFGDLSLWRREWPIIYRPTSWNRSEWPMPAFVRSELSTGRRWRVEYDDGDPNHVLSEARLPSTAEGLERDSVLGSGAVELQLTKLLSTVT
jgi:hypothetical protein